MSNKLYEETHIQNIANAIREKTGKTDPLKVSGMAAEIESVKVYVDPKLQDKTVTENGTVEADEGYDGLGKVTVEVVEDLSNISELLGADVDDTKDDIETSVSGLLDLANDTTGNTDTNLTDGVNALVSGYGQGGEVLPIAEECGF